MVITPRLQALMDSKKAAKATTTSTPKTTSNATGSVSSWTPLIQHGTVSQTYVNTPNGYVAQSSIGSSTPKATTQTPSTTTSSSSSGLLGKDLIQQANTQGLTGSARRDYIEAGRTIATPVVSTPKVSTPATSTIQSSLSSGGSTKAPTTTSAPATIQSATTSSKVTATPSKTTITPTTVTPAASSINAGVTTKTVLSPQTTLTPSSPEAKKTGKQLIAETNQLGLKWQARRDYILKGRENKPIAEENTILKQQTNLFEDQKREEERFKNEEQARVNLDESSLLAAKAKNKETLDKYFVDTEEQENKYFNDYEAEQNKLFSEWESTQLNQVRSQIYQALAARGIDISKLPPEQLIALSGEVGTKAFSNIYQMKEWVKNKILAASRDKVNKLNELRSKKTINENEYNEAVQAVNSQANLQRSQIDSTFAKSILGVQASKLNLASTAQAENANVVTNIATNLKLSPEQIGLVSKYIDPNKTAAENQSYIYALMADPKNELNAVTKENRAKESAALQAEINAKINMNAADNLTKENVARIQAEVDAGRLGIEQAKLDLDKIVEKTKIDSGYYKAPANSTNWWTQPPVNTQTNASGGASSTAP